MISSFVPSICRAWDWSNMNLWRNLVCGSGKARIFVDVLALPLHVGWNVNSLSDGRGNVELGALASRAAYAWNSRHSNHVAVTTSHPIAKLPVGRVVVEMYLLEKQLEISNAYEENASMLLSEAYCLCVIRIVAPVWVWVTKWSFICICSRRISELKDLYAIR